MSDISDSKLEDTLKLIESGGDEKEDEKKRMMLKITMKIKLMMISSRTKMKMIV